MAMNAAKPCFSGQMEKNFPRALAAAFSPSNRAWCLRRDQLLTERHQINDARSGAPKPLDIEDRSLSDSSRETASWTA